MKLDPDRYFDPQVDQRNIARELYQSVADMPIVSPHGHVDPTLFVDEDASFGTPTELLIIPDHYVFRMLYSQGITLESLGVPRTDGGPVETDHRKIWQVFAENFYLFRGTPSGAWLNSELVDVFGIFQKLNGDTAQKIYDQIAEKLAQPAFQPRALFEKFNIEVLCTTDSATDTLDAHRKIRASGWQGVIRPTFRPDNIFNLLTPAWPENIAALSEVSGIDISSYPSFIEAVEKQRAAFKSLGATASDHAAISAYTHELSSNEAENIFQHALKRKVTEDEVAQFSAHMLMESARMSLEDGLVMQIHVGSIRNHNRSVFEKFGPDKGGDIPERSEFTHNLSALLNKYGNEPNLSLILFTVDETTLARELAPLAGHYPALKLGPPWWFYDSVNGMKRYFDLVMETAGIYNTVGFNDDTRAFPSIPARHDVWRRVSANWLAGLVIRGIVDLEDAQAMIVDLAYNLVKKAYRLDAS
ncbi:MAG: glucuronate isomerase [Anaerolineales bacterium]|jgi:glucuronate isomerase